RRGGRAVELAKEPQCLAVVVLLAGGPAVLDVVGLDVPEVAEDQLVDRQPPIGWTGGASRGSLVGVGPPLGGQAGGFSRGFPLRGCEFFVIRTEDVISYVHLTYM